jgi:hypothetical protein
MKRIEREIRTVGIMIDLYCRNHHSGEKRCDGCQELYLYAHQRSVKCPFGEEKPACGKCPVHCYRKGMKAKMREVMKFSGPKMVRSHPFLALQHLWMAARREPPVTGKMK